MPNYFLGILTGLILAGAILIGLPFLAQPALIGRLATTNRSGQSAATAANVSWHVPASQRFPLTVAVSDTQTNDPNQSTTDLTSLSVTLSAATLTPTRFADPTVELEPNHQETLNLTQPTIELMSLRGSGGLAELANADLAAGTYQSLELTISSLRGRQSSGHIIELPLTPQNSSLRIPLSQSWSPATPVQIVIDLDSLASLTQTATTYSFAPILRQIFINDEPLNNF